MQSYNENNDLVQTVPVDPDDAEDLKAKIKEAEQKHDAKHHHIGRLPDKGNLLKINGLVYEVKFVDYKRGEIKMKIVKKYQVDGLGRIIKMG